MKRLIFGTLASLMFIAFLETLVSMKRVAQMPSLRRSLSALIVSLVLTSASHAQLENMKIAFESERDGNKEIYVMDADGKNLVNLTNHPARDTSPSWSPDGQKITFVSNRDGNGEIYVMDADGKNPINLTNHPARDWAPSWSPDGKKIAFMSLRDGNKEIYVMDADGKNPINLTNHAADDWHPSWFPLSKSAVSFRGRFLTLWGKVKVGK